MPRDIFFAAKFGEVKGLQYWIEQAQVSVNSKDAQGLSPLYWACVSDRVEAVKYLLAQKPDFDLASPEGQRTWNESQAVRIRNLLLGNCRCSDHELYLQLAGVKPAPPKPVQPLYAPPAPSHIGMAPRVQQLLPAVGPQPQLQQQFAEPSNIPSIQSPAMMQPPQVPAYAPNFQQQQQPQQQVVYYVLPPAQAEQFLQSLRNNQSTNVPVMYSAVAPNYMPQQQPYPQVPVEQPVFFQQPPQQQHIHSAQPVDLLS